MKMTLRLILALSISCTYCGCYDVVVNHQLLVTNSSNASISVVYSNALNSSDSENNLEFYLSNQSVIPQDSSRYILKIGKNAWQEYIDKGVSKELVLFVFKVDSLKNYQGRYNINELVAQHKYSKELIYSTKMLDKLNWQVVIK